MRKYVLFALLVTLCLSGAAFAQTTMPVYCGELSEADCAILTNSQSAMSTLDAASFDLTINATIANVPDMKEPLTFSIVGNGSYSGASSLHSDMLAMMSAPAEQMNPAQMYVTLLDKFDADLTLTLALPPELLRAANNPAMPGNITLQARLVDGVGYINFDPLQPILNQPNLKGWGGLDLASLLKEALKLQPDLFRGMSGMGASAMSGVDMTHYMQQFSDPQFLSQFMTITRTDDGTGDTATFQMTLDFAALMSSPAMHDMMMQQMQMQGQMMTDAQIEQAMAMSAQMMQDMTMSIDQEIGVTDGFVRSVHGMFAFDMSGMMSALDSGSMKKQSAGSAQSTAPSVNVDFTLTFRDFNNITPITAPTDVMMLPYQMLLAGLPTPVPSPTATTVFVPTAVPTATGTAEVTAEPTSEATAEPTQEATEPGGGTGEPTQEATEPGGGTGEPTQEVTTEPGGGGVTEPTPEVTAAS